MNNKQTLSIHTGYDVINVRAKVRNVAREAGLNMMDQVRISLATSALAQALGLGELHAGQTTIDTMPRGNRLGVRVVCCVEQNDNPFDHESAALQDARLMVDEMTVELQSTNDLRVTLIKWTT